MAAIAAALAFGLAVSCCLDVIRGLRRDNAALVGVGFVDGAAFVFLGFVLWSLA